MEDILKEMKDILDQGISGYHQYVLTDPVHLEYASQNLCTLLGVCRKELLSDTQDLYAARVHPADLERYQRFLRSLRMGEQTASCRYRIRKKEGAFLYVNDTVTVRRRKDGTLCGSSVLSDITEVMEENAGLRFLDETIPCGFMKYTCEKQPRLTYMNRRMRELLRFSGTQAEEELFRDNIFLMIPVEERRRFALYLKRVRASDVPAAGELTLLRCDGSRAHVFGWVARCVNEQGEEEFQSVCMDMTERHRIHRARETRRYLQALSEVYDKIFEYDLGTEQVICRYSAGPSRFKWMENIPMQMEEATEKWIGDTVVPEDGERVRAFFRDFCSKRMEKQEGSPPQISYRAWSTEGRIREYRGIFLKMEGQISLYCCRRVPEQEETSALRSENLALRENLQELLMRFTDGIAAFEVKENRVRPLYASDNVCGFFGFAREEWLELMKKSTPIREFVARCALKYEDFAELLRKGEAEFSYMDLAAHRERRIRAVCSRKDGEEGQPGYVMLYSMEDKTEREEPGETERRVSIRTFGYFDVFVGERPIAFRNKKAKELFALLTDRRGGYVTSEEAIGFLWEEEPVSPVTLARYRKVALRLKNTLEEYGILEVMESVDGKRRIVPERVRCDLYDYLSGREEYARLFKGSYLANYSWGENTLAQLTGEMLY